MRLAVIAAILALSTPVFAADDEEPIQGKPCIKAEAIYAAFREQHITVMELHGKELTAFNGAYEKKFGRHGGPDVDSVLFAEDGDSTFLFTFKDGCMHGQGRAKTNIVHELLRDSLP